MLDRFRGSGSKGMSARTDPQNGRGSDVKDQLAFDRTLQLVIDDPLINLFQKSVSEEIRSGSGSGSGRSGSGHFYGRGMKKTVPS